MVAKAAAITALAIVAIVIPRVGQAAPLPAPSPCSTVVTRGLVELDWTAVPSAQTYLVTRDGIPLASVPAPAASYKDLRPLLGIHEYCVQATGAGFDPSDLCCTTAPDAFVPANPEGLHASTDLFGKIRFAWQSVDGATQYAISRDGQPLHTSAADETTYVDEAVFGSHQYCLQALNAIGLSGKICTTGAASDTGAFVRLSWGTCSPQVSTQDFHGPDVYTLIASVRGVPMVNVGHDTEITIAPGVPDAWRFDDGGCQTLKRIDLKNEPLGADCPAMLGFNSLTITDYQEDPHGAGSATLRLAITYDDLATDPNQRYVLWKIGFDHSHSVAGTDNDPATCDGVDVPVTLTVMTHILLTYGQYQLPAAPEPSDSEVRWTGLMVPVRTQNTTWGRLKSLYR
jgi:hypothetical protein